MPPGIIPAEVINGNYGEGADGIVSNGEVTFEYNMKGLFEESNVILQTVHICDLPEAALQNGLKIYNWQKNAWVDASPEKKLLTSDVNTQDMVSLSGEGLANALSTEKILRLNIWSFLLMLFKLQGIRKKQLFLICLNW